jgi:flagellar hook-length control protein FliK
MSENFLSFVTSAISKPAEAGPEVPGNPESKSAQGTEFAGIFKKEQAKASGMGSLAEQQIRDASALLPVGEETLEDPLGEAATTTETPVPLPVLPPTGNALPELSIHSRGLQVGRVILTTANPRVSEESLNQFAQSQAADAASLEPEHLNPLNVTPSAQQTRGVLEGLMGQQQAGASAPTQSALGQHQPAATVDAVKQGMTLPRPAADQRQPFGNWHQYTQAESFGDSQEYGKGVAASVGESLAAKNALAPNTSKDVINKANGHQTNSRSPLSSMMIGDVTPERMLDPLSISGASDMPAEAIAASSAPVASSGPTQSQGVLAQSPATVLSAGLAEALTATDSTQMQSRLQPYQAWAQRFGEVLAQKLSLAVRDGNWSVKLNLNPASLGPVGVELQVNNGGIEAQIAANDANVRQLLNDSLPRLRQSLEALVSENAGVNIELSDHRENDAKQQREPDLEIPVDLLAEEFIPLKEAIADGNILRDGLSVFV